MALERRISTDLGVAVVGEDVGDSVDGGFEPDRVSGGGAGDDQFEAVFGGAAEPDETFLCGSFGVLFGAIGVSLDDCGLEQGLQPAPRHRAQGWCEVSIHRGGLSAREMASGVGDATGLVGRHLPCLGCHPD